MFNLRKIRESSFNTEQTQTQLQRCWVLNLCVTPLGMNSTSSRLCEAFLCMQFPPALGVFVHEVPGTDCVRLTEQPI